MVTLRLDGLGAAYGRRTVLSAVTTPAFAGGELVAVIGPNASGKSTLLRRIAGLMPGAGRVVLDGTGRGSDAVAYMPQDSATQAVLTVYESVLLARKRDAAWAVRADDLAVADAVLGQLGIADLAMRSLGELSGGQRQLASIAQVLAREPEVLLMDEPTSALDLHRQVQVLAFVRELARRRGLLVIAALHDLNHVLRFADRVMVMHGGAVHACGACDEVLTPALLREVYRVEARIERCSRGGRHVIVDAAAADRELENLSPHGPSRPSAARRAPQGDRI